MKSISKSATPASTEANTPKSGSETPPSKSGKIDEQDLPE
jgi:hypothetical protein